MNDTTAARARRAFRGAGASTIIPFSIVVGTILAVIVSLERDVPFWGFWFVALSYSVLLALLLAILTSNGAGSR